MSRAREHSGFTLVELIVVMGLLAGFLLFLTQILADSVGLWQEGESRAAQEARAAVALDFCSADLARLASVETSLYETGRAAVRAPRAQGGRLRADFVAIRPDRSRPPAEALADKPLAFDWYPRLRFVAALDKREVQRAEIVEGPVYGEVCLRAVPTGEEGGCYLALYRDLRVLASPAAAPGPRWVDGAPLPQPGRPWVANLLHVEFLFRSQYTIDFDAAPGSKDGPESCWDSARAGTFPAEHPVLRFSLDLDAQSLADPLDDVVPRAVRILVVVDDRPEAARTAFLTEAIDARATRIRVDYPERLPRASSQPFVKIGSEWIRFSGVVGDRLVGVQRGQRHTAPRAHAEAARVHGGRQAILTVPLTTAREYWNG